MSIERLITRLFAVMAICVFACAAAFAQAGATGQISGRVTDMSGGILPGVDVTVTQTATGTTRAAVTNETGIYSFPNLPLGPYRLEAALPGFRKFVQQDIVLQINNNLTIDATMQVGDITQAIEVTAYSQTQVETRSMGVGTIVETERVLELPLNARQVTDLITLAGAAVPAPPSVTATMVTGVNIAVAGGERFGVTYLLDGAMSNNRFDQANLPLPFPDALQEFKVSTSSQEAGTGRASGASVNVVTRQGANQFHGSAFWFVRNAVFNAIKADARRDARTGLAIKDQLKRNQFGGTLGGPIVQNKLFFFTGYQGTILRQTPPETDSFVPTPAMLRGDWSAFNNCYRPAWRDTDFADGQVDPARYSNAARLIAAKLPPAQNDCGLVRYVIRAERHDKQFVGRADYQHTASHMIFGRYMSTLQDAPVTFDSSNLLTASVAGSGFNDRAHQAVVGNTWVISPKTVSSSRFSYSRVTAKKIGARFFDPQDVGVNHWTSVPQHFVLTVDGAFQFGSGPTALRRVFQNQYQAGSDLSLSRGSHQISLGATWARDDVESYAHTRGVGGMTVSPRDTGHAMGDFMLGRLTQIRQSMPSTLSPYQHYFGAYAHDTWRFSPKWTLNYGVRWEPYLPMVWNENDLGGIRVYNFSVADFKAGKKSVVFPGAPAGFTYPSQKSDGSGPADFEGGSGVPARWNKLAPRVGFAWDPTGSGRTAIRAGYSIAYDVIAMESLLNTNNVSPWAADISYANGTLDNPWQGFELGNPFPFDWRATPRFAPGSLFIAFGKDLDITYSQSWNLGVQQQLGQRWLLSATYLGNQGVGLWNTTAVNPAQFLTPQSHPGLFTGPNTCVLEGVTYNPCNNAANVNQRRELRLWASTQNPERLPDARLFSTIDEFRSDSTSSYHGLLMAVRGDFRGVTLNANHTWSHCISDRTNVSIANPNQTFHRGRDRANCSSDRRHIFNMTAVADTPRFERRSLRLIASDWKVSVIYRVNSAPPLTIHSGTDRAFTFLEAQTANQLRDNVYLDRSGNLGTQFLDSTAFAAAADGQYGNMDRWSVRGFNEWTLDAAISRSFRITEGQRIEIRAEAFNLPNAVKPVNPLPINPNAIPAQTVITNPNFGRVINSHEPRIMQWALKYVF
jgi:hypothetical protein